MQNDLSMSPQAEALGLLPRASRGGKWLRSCASVLLAGTLLGAAACGDDRKPPEEKPPEEKPLSIMAEKGLTIAPFQLDVAGLSNAEKERIGLGSYYVNSLVLCNDCHQQPNPSGPPGYLGGGLPFQIGGAGERVYSRNLTPDSETGLKLSEAEFVEAMRTGKDFRAEGEPEQLIVMPWTVYRWMTEEDLKSIYAYLKKVPALKNKVPDDIKGALAAAKPVPFPDTYTDGEVARKLPAENASGTLNTERGLAIQTLADPPTLEKMSASERAMYARGSYLVNAVGDCTGCHTNPLRDFAPGPNYLKLPVDKWLTGGQIFAVPPGLDALLKTKRSMTGNLLGVENGAFSKFTSYEDFRKVIFDGKISRGSVTRDLAFPMNFIAEGMRKANEDDLKAIYTYLKHQVPRTGAGDKKIQEPVRWCAADTDCNTGAGEVCDTNANECVGATCSQDVDCGACQTCSTNKCVAPAADSLCLVQGK